MLFFLAHLKDTYNQNIFRTLYASCRLDAIKEAHKLAKENNWNFIELIPQD